MDEISKHLCDQIKDEMEKIDDTANEKYDYLGTIIIKFKDNVEYQNNVIVGKLIDELDDIKADLDEYNGNLNLFLEKEIYPIRAKLSTEYFRLCEQLMSYADKKDSESNDYLTN